MRSGADNNSERFGRAMAQARNVLGAKPEEPTASKDEMLHTVDMQIAVLLQEATARKAMGVGEAQLGDIERSLGDLRSLRERIDGTNSPSMLAQLRTQMDESMRGANATLQSSGAISATSSTTLATRQMAEAEFHARMTNIERAAAPLVAQSERLAGEADSMAKRMGLDTSHFTELNDQLKRSAADKRKKGDRVGAMEDDTLAAWNTVNHWDDIAANAKTDADRQAAQRKADEARAAAEKQEQLLRQAVEARVTRDAASMSFNSPEDRAAFIKAKTDAGMKGFQDKKADIATLKGMSPAQGSERVADMKAGWIGSPGTAINEPAANDKDGLAESTPPGFAKQDAQQAKASAEEPAEGAGASSKPTPRLGDMASAATAPAPISLAQLGEQAKQAVQDSPVKDSGVDVQVAEAQQGLPAKSADPSKAPVRAG